MTFRKEEDLGETILIPNAQDKASLFARRINL
jgi:hypothetical protein